MPVLEGSRISARRVPGTFYDPRDHGRVGRPAVELGVLRRGAARDHAATLGDPSAISGASAGTSTSRTTRRVGRGRLHASTACAIPTDLACRRPAGRYGGIYDQAEPGRLHPQRHQVRRRVRQTAIALEWGRRHHRRAAQERSVPFQGGVSTGNTMTDNCEVIEQVPEVASVDCGTDGGADLRVGIAHRGAAARGPKRILPSGDRPFPHAVQGVGILLTSVYDVRIGGSAFESIHWAGHQLPTTIYLGALPSRSADHSHGASTVNRRRAWNELRGPAESARFCGSPRYSPSAAES